MAPALPRYVRHLRLPFNALLSPIYLWGALLAGGTLSSPRFWLGYAALHLFLYGGTTALNSYYDRDEGPIGGMLEPPPVDRGLLRFSLVVQAAGLALAAALGASFAACYLALFAVATAYSHPRTRLKADPLKALLAVGLGQGGLGLAAGWLLFVPDPLSLLAPRALWGMLSSALIVSGLYLVTQSYQSAEDRARGDRTLSVLWGPRRALRFATLLLAAGGASLLAHYGALFGWGWGAALGGFFAAIGLYLLRWAGRFEEAEVRRNFYTTMRLATLSSLGLSLFLLWQLR